MPPPARERASGFTAARTDDTSFGAASSVGHLTSAPTPAWSERPGPMSRSAVPSSRRPWASARAAVQTVDPVFGDARAVRADRFGDDEGWRYRLARTGRVRETHGAFERRPASPVPKSVGRLPLRLSSQDRSEEPRRSGLTGKAETTGVASARNGARPKGETRRPTVSSRRRPRPSAERHHACVGRQKIPVDRRRVDVERGRIPHDTKVLHIDEGGDHPTDAPDERPPRRPSSRARRGRTSRRKGKSLMNLRSNEGFHSRTSPRASSHSKAL